MAGVTNVFFASRVLRNEAKEVLPGGWIVSVNGGVADPTGARCVTFDGSDGTSSILAPVRGGDTALGFFALACYPSAERA